MYNEENKLMYFKTIIQGKLEFGHQRSYDKVVKMFDHRLENYYRNIISIEAEEIFDTVEHTLYIKRTVLQASDKSWRNTADILEYCAQFAVSGMIGIWMTDNGQILRYKKIVPKGDKKAVRNFIKGRTLFKKDDKPEEAMGYINKAIEKYEKHANAYEIRAFINMKLEKYHDAKRDFTKCLSYDENIPHAYFGRAQVCLIQGEEDEAILDLIQTTKKAIALQPVFWKARKQLADLYMKQGNVEKAMFELKVYAKRNFDVKDVNYAWKRWTLYNYGVLAMESEMFLEALESFDEAMLHEENQNGKIDYKTLLRCRGQAKKYTGKRGYVKDLKEAAELGDKIAAELLKKKPRKTATKKLATKKV